MRRALVISMVVAALMAVNSLSVFACELIGPSGG